MPFYRLAIPVVVLLLLSIYLTIEVSQTWAMLIVFFVVVLLGGLIISPIINWWWWERFPPDLPKDLHGLIEHKVPFYQKLDQNGRREFRRRVYLFSQGTNFMEQGLEKVAEDAKLMIAVAPVSMGFYDETFLFEKFENIVVYPHPFPSPRIPEKLHTSEIYEDDGVIMFSLQHIVRGYLDPQKYFNPAWYEYARVYLMTYPDLKYGDWSLVDWSQLEQISGFSKEALEKWVGLPNLNKNAFTIAFYFLRPQRFQKKLPKMFDSLQLIFSSK